MMSSKPIEDDDVFLWLAPLYILHLYLSQNVFKNHHYLYHSLDIGHCYILICIFLVLVGMMEFFKVIKLTNTVFLAQSKS